MGFIDYMTFKIKIAPNIIWTIHAIFAILWAILIIVGLVDKLYLFSPILDLSPLYAKVAYYLLFILIMLFIYVCVRVWLEYLEVLFSIDKKLDKKR